MMTECSICHAPFFGYVQQFQGRKKALCSGVRVESSGRRICPRDTRRPSSRHRPFWKSAPLKNLPSRGNTPSSTRKARGTRPLTTPMPSNSLVLRGRTKAYIPYPGDRYLMRSKPFGRSSSICTLVNAAENLGFGVILGLYSSSLSLSFDFMGYPRMVSRALTPFVVGGSEGPREVTISHPIP